MSAERAVAGPAVDVAIVNWNTAPAALAAARACLASEGVATNVTVVDNGSEPAGLRELEASLPDGAELLASGENLGFGAAANRALVGGEAALVCVANADIVPEPGALAALAAIAAGPDVGMVGPSFGPGDRYHAELPGSLALLGQAFAGSFLRRTVPDPAPGEVREIGQPSGACFVIRREAWEHLGGFDEGYFLWFEDVDLARRARDAGLRNMIAGSARVAHAEAQSFRQRDERGLRRIRLASLRRYVGLHHPRLAPLAAPLIWISRLAGDLRGSRAGGPAR